jgi:outer membrane protein assembly factor BamB
MTDSIGYLYVFDMNGKLLNKKEYAKEWTINYNGSRGTVTANDGKLYIYSGAGHLVCLNQNTLDVLWKKDIVADFGGKNIRWGVNEAPLIIDEKVIITAGGKKHNIVALNKNDGSTIWSSAAEGSVSAYCSPLYLADQQVPQIATITATHVVGIDVANGKMLWSYPYENSRQIHANTPVYHNNMLLCTSGYDYGSVMLRLTNGGRDVEKAWDSRDLETQLGGIVKLGDYIYASGHKSKPWTCMEWNTGKVMYKDNTLGATGATIFADGMLYCYSEKGDMALVKPTPEKFDIVSKFPITLGTAQHWAHPVIYKGVLYVRHGSAVMAYKIK